MPTRQKKRIYVKMTQLSIHDSKEKRKSKRKGKRKVEGVRKGEGPGGKECSGVDLFSRFCFPLDGFQLHPRSAIFVSYFLFSLYVCTLSIDFIDFIDFIYST